ncbi:MAG TPA: hypothetical protein VGM88_14515 [Kofleriaceae bacterium]|jgi:hypothetical protein
MKALVLLAVLAAPAYADDVSGSYDVKVDEVPTNCPNAVHYPASMVVKIAVRGGTLQVDLDVTPTMTGTPSKTGKINARSKLVSVPRVAGMLGTFSVGGRVASDGLLSLVMNGEFQTADKRPLCTQSWNLAGVKQDAAKPKKP